MLYRLSWLGEDVHDTVYCSPADGTLGQQSGTRGAGVVVSARHENTVLGVGRTHQTQVLPLVVLS